MGSVDLRYMRLVCVSVIGLALECRVHISLSFNIFIINKCSLFCLFSSLILTCVGAYINVYNAYSFYSSFFYFYVPHMPFILFNYIIIIIRLHIGHGIKCTVNQ